MIGAGIAGITTAYLLKRAGKRVALVEAGELAAGVTGHTTAKITAQHGAIYGKLLSSYSAEVAEAYARSQELAMAWIFAESASLGIDCDLSRRVNYLYAEHEKLNDEAAAAVTAGLDASYVNDLDLPYTVEGAVRLPDQAQFHPRTWLLGLAQHIPGDGSYIRTGTRATGLTEGSPNVVETTAGEIRAEHVVVATHYPIFDRGLFFARLQPKRDLVVASVIDGGSGPSGMYLAQDTGHSVRTTPHGDGKDLLIIGGEGHLVDEGAPVAERFRRLTAWASTRFGIGEPDYRWMAHDLSTPDSLPYIGRFHPGTRTVWVATGFAHWGMSNGTLAGLLLHDLITGVENPYEHLYDPLRLNLRQSVPKLVAANAHVAARFVGDHVSAVAHSVVDNLAPGEARVSTEGAHPVAAYRSEDGELHRVSARCTHLGCLVAFNDGDRTWDCPCHGSRFGLDGSVIQGPAVRPLRTE
ncbi:FAD-dependent oxidoreductase [Allokutzneria sp. A3M-2-11 16]|uniref:FAD-dependent oxidoreductase n=1 Tax=Allokutzneria sp. A3M-2-11 16 TaxID=2962043 RepID=UPI0020B6B6EC|nr:FAD-dependent oxidoreductase [Allokutzneria sp. A3M-2-11 16]MCP3804892.1 FAD-dependent oxidoreductase [Allokutzneria sp. A3M-2-11 16]